VFDRGIDGDAASQEAFGAIANVHRLMSFHDAHSDVSRLNRDAWARPVTVDAWTFAVLQMAADLRARSHGAFDVAVAPALQEIGLLPRHEARCFMPLRPGGCAIELLPPATVRFHDPGVRIDLGGIAKGFAVDRAVEALKRFGVSAGVVNAGGDVAVFGPMPHVISLRYPGDPRILMCDVAVTNGALASSGARFDPSLSWQPTTPSIIDPRTRRAPMARGATVRASSCMVADALTKLVMIDAEAADALLRQFQASALVVSADGRISVSAGWHGVESVAA
jgi:thiamine biosynthesis lipoprotein